ncbi:MAG: helix-turn-helix transcriptional regulator [Desulfobacteraceae bacterium]|nr:helix-turn-helix transcriptional regulator [Desulfobacteraceae bacterium]
MDRCQEKIIHTELVNKAIDNLPTPRNTQAIADIFKAMGDPTRLKMVVALSVCELCVCDLSAVCDLSESATSHQLRILRNLRIVKNRREGKIVYYSLDDDHVRMLIKQSLDHVTE